jgi:hypothetical protein
VTPVLTGLGLAAAAGLNAWIVLLLVNGLALLLPQEFPGTTTAFLTSHGVVTAALILFLAEFVADKIPIVDHLWNLAQTLLRPLVGALLVLACVPEASAMERLLLALGGAAVTVSTHLAQVTTRLTSTAATRGLAQVAVSLAEDVLALAFGALVFFVPPFSAVFLGAIAILLVADRKRVLRGLAVMFFRIRHPRRRARAEG